MPRHTPPQRLRPRHIEHGVALRLPGLSHAVVVPTAGYLPPAEFERLCSTARSVFGAQLSRTLISSSGPLMAPLPADISREEAATEAVAAAALAAHC